MAYADAVNGEIRDLFDAGADFVQIDEPYRRRSPRRLGATRSGDQPRARGHRRHDDRAPVLRLRRNGENGQADRYAFWRAARHGVASRFRWDRQPRLDCSTLAATG